jgi:hypothetical protein
LANQNESETSEDGGDLPRLQNGNVAHRLGDLHRLRSDELPFKLWRAILQQHGDNLFEVLAELVESGTLRVRTGPAGNVADEQPRGLVALDDQLSPGIGRPGGVAFIRRLRLRGCRALRWQQHEHDALTSLAGLRALARVDGDISVEANAVLQDVAVLEDITFAGPSLTIMNNPSLPSCQARRVYEAQVAKGRTGEARICNSLKDGCEGTIDRAYLD